MKTSKHEKHVPDVFDTFVAVLQNRLQSQVGPIFDAGAGFPDNLIAQMYLDSFPARESQYYNCRACLRFLEKYAGAVVWEDGRWKSVFWEGYGSVPEEYVNTEQVLRMLFRNPKQGRLMPLMELPQVMGTEEQGRFSHFRMKIQNSRVQASEQVHEQREAFKRLSNSGYGILAVTKAQAILEAAGLASSALAKVQLEFLAQWATASTNDRHVLSTKGPAFSHPKACVVGTVLDDVIAGKGPVAIVAAFRAKTGGTVYQRPTAPVSSQSLALTEKAFKDLGLERSLHRTYFDVHSTPEPAVLFSSKSAQTEGLFAGVPVKGKKPTVSERTCSWHVFARDFLPKALSIKWHVPREASLATLTQAYYEEAPRVLQWDSQYYRNTAAWSLPSVPKSMIHYLKDKSHGSWVDVMKVIKSPAGWGGQSHSRFSQSVFLCLDAVSTETTTPHSGLFPEVLAGHMHDHKRTIDLLNNTRNPAFWHGQPVPGATAVCIHPDSKFNMTLRVSMPHDLDVLVTIDRFE